MSRRTRIAIAIVGLVGVAICATIFLRPVFQAFSLSSAIERLDACANGEHATPCAQPVVAKMLVTQKASEIMKTIQKRYSPVQCHFIGHAVGRETYKKYGNTESALSECNNLCDYACPHGVIGEALIEAAGIDSPSFDAEHLRLGELRSLSAQLCQSPEACHGIGHALFQITQSFNPGIEICNEAATSSWPLEYCYRGMFMEYANSMSGQGLRLVPGLASREQKLDTVCNLKTLVLRRACLRYFPHMVMAQPNAQAIIGEKRADYLVRKCNSFTSSDRRACIAGVGVYYVDLLSTEPDFLLSVCERFSAARDQESCILGVVSSTIEGRYSTEMNFCSSFSSDEVKKKCYEAIFYALKYTWHGYLINTAKRQCKEAICSAAAVTFDQNMWDTVIGKD